VYSRTVRIRGLRRPTLPPAGVAPGRAAELLVAKRR
jgi:hypothetical protein